MRIKLTISYNGASFMGSQTQNTTSNTVLGLLEKALFRLGIKTRPIASGRTDRGVHATRQVLHFDIPPFWSDLLKLEHSLSFQLPDTIAIRKIEYIGADFHARYSAKKRTYRYIISNKKANPFEADLVTFKSSLDFEKISSAIKLFEGEHDFTYFKKSGSNEKHCRRTIFKAFAYQYRGYTVLVFEANGFLRAQIRLMVGFLLGISSGRLSEKQLLEQLQCKAVHNRKPAPHNGLYLARITYS
jgi:tRNA pseudouridine38-40 synthase